MLTKKQLLKHLDKIPEKFSIEELIDRLILIEKIEEGKRQSRQNQVIPEDQLKKEIKSWSK